MNAIRNTAGRWVLALGILSVIPFVTFAERAEHTGAGAGAGGGAGRSGEEARWKAVSEFMQQHSKRKWAAYQKLTQTNPRPNLKQQLVSSYDELEHLAKQDSQLYENEVRRVEIEDQIFDGLVNLHQARTEPEKELARKALRPAVRQLVLNRMDEHKVRQQSLQKALKVVDEQVRKDDEVRNNEAEFDRRIQTRFSHLEKVGLEPSGSIKQGFRLDNSATRPNSISEPGLDSE